VTLYDVIAVASTAGFRAHRERIKNLRLTSITILSGLKATYISHPDQFGVADEQFTLTCNKSTEGPVSWWYRSYPDAVNEEISFGGTLLDWYADRCRLDGDNLIIDNLELNDTGTYICLEQAGHGVRHLIFLNVSGKVEICISP